MSPSVLVNWRRLITAESFSNLFFRSLDVTQFIRSILFVSICVVLLLLREIRKLCGGEKGLVLRFEIVLSLVVLTGETWRRLNAPPVRNIRKEGNVEWADKWWRRMQCMRLDWNDGGGQSTKTSNDVTKKATTHQTAYDMHLDLLLQS